MRNRYCAESLTTAVSELSVAFGAALQAGDGNAIVLQRSRVSALESLASEAQLEALKTMIRSTVTWYEPDELPPTAGVYIITTDAAIERSALGDESYIGIAKDIYSRFHRADFGHLTNNSTRSRRLVDSTGFKIGVLESMEGLDDHEANDLMAVREVYWYSVLRLAGLKCVNQISNLGRTSTSEDLPIVCVDLSNGRHRVFRSQSEATRVLKMLPGRVAPVVSGYQNQNSGYSFRLASPSESILSESKWIPGCWLPGASDATITGGSLSWSTGAMAPVVREQLSSSKRPAEYEKARHSGYKGVTATPGKDARWTAYYVTDPTRRSRWTAVGRAYASPSEAAEARETFLDSRPDLASINQRNPRPTVLVQ